ncbi:MAG: SRPBCC domain-containing protein [Nannocystaceae bacterium]
MLARASVRIDAARQAVWRLLIAPEMLPRIMPIRAVIAPWRLAAPFKWVFELGGESADIDGFVHRVEEARRLDYDYVDPHSRLVMGVADNVHRVTIELSDEDDATRVVVTQDGNISEAARAHAAGGWRLALHNLKALAERAR